MAQITPETLARLAELQPGLWNVVAGTVSDAAGSPFRMENPLTTTAKPGDLQADVATAQLVIQFALASLPESFHTVLIRPETLLDLARLLTGVEAADVDENIVADVRPIAEAIVQGLCLGIGRAVSDNIVATSLSIRYQPIHFPPNFQRAAEIVRVNVAVEIGDPESEELKGVFVWAFDKASAALLLGENPTEEEPEDEPAPFAPANPNAFPRTNAASAEAGKLDILLDVPLEISVELGRVRMTVREVVDLGTGSIVEVDKAAGEPVDVMVNGRLVAKGEVVVIEDNFGVRITEILNPNERLGRLEHAA